MKVSEEILKKLFEKFLKKDFVKNPKKFPWWGFYFLFDSNNMTPQIFRSVEKKPT